MGWFWNTPSDSAKDTTFSHLSPEARAFLEKEAPIKPSTSQAGSSSPTSSPSAAKEVDPTAFSAYGPKYSDIWAQYRPLGVVEAEAKTPQMAVEDVYTSYKERQAGIGRAALENCVFEQAALHDCYGNGQLRSLVGCRGESRTLDSCYKSQQAFLKQLGYLSDANRSPEVDEKIQMHADKLYREQVKREAQIEANAAAGRPLDSPSPDGEKPLS